MSKLLKSIKLQSARLRRKLWPWKKHYLDKIPWHKLSWQKIKIPTMVVLALAIGGLFIFLLSKLPPRAPRFKKNQAGHYVFEAKNKVFQTKLGLKDQQPVLFFGITKEQSITLIYQSDVINDAQLEAKGQNLTFNEVEPGLQIKYQTLPNGIKEEIILHQPRQKENSANVFLFEADFQGVKAKEFLRGIAETVFVDSAGKYLFHFEEPFAIDAAGNRTDNVTLQIESKLDSKLPSVKRSIDGETSHIVRLTVDETWLNDPARVYPITIDPTVIHDTSIAFSVGQFNRVKDLGSSTPQLENYYQELGADFNTVGLWHMNEISGAAVTDSSGNNNNGTATGTTIVDGLLGKARSFNGSSHYVVIPNHSSLNPTSITIEAWIKPNVLQAGNFVNKGDNNGYRFRVLNTGAVQFLDRGATNIITSPTNVVSPGVWVHVAVVGDASGLKIYINGGLTTSNNTAYGGPSTSDSLVLGRYSTGSEYFSGDLDEVRISNIARTPEEIKAAASRRPYAVYTSDVLNLTDVTSWNNLSWLANGNATGDGETPHSSTDLIAQWNFNETSGTAAISSGSCGSACDGELINFSNTNEQDASLETTLATGGTISYSNGYTIHTFTSSGTFTPSQNMNVQVLVVGGGGGSGGGGNTGWAGGGGGGGGVIHNTTYNANSSPLTVTVGSGGAAGWASGDAGRRGGQGGNSVFDSLTAIGGGGGGGNPGYSEGVGGSGGSGGGGATYSSAGGTGTTGQGYNGGSASASCCAGGGGGGAGGAGGSTSNTVGGNAGAGAAVAITGTNILYGGGGAGKGSGGNGSAANGGTAVDTNGAANTGAGGGGVRSTSGRAGGSGVVVVRYPTPYKSGWTAKNKRWGNGALFFDGLNDYIDVSSVTFNQNGVFSMEFWFNPMIGAASQYLFDFRAADASGQAATIAYNHSLGRIGYAVYGSTFIHSSNLIATSEWSHVVVTHNSNDNTVDMYINGILDSSQTYTQDLTITSAPLRIGSRLITASNPYSGSMDVVRLYDRSLATSEILSNYNSSRVELQTRVGNSADANDGSWENWVGLNIANQLLNFNNTTLYNTSGLGLVGYWPLDETSGSVATDIVSSNDGTVVGSLIVDGVFNKARGFNGTSDLIAIPHHDSLNMTSAVTIEMWAKFNSVSIDYQEIFNKRTNGPPTSTNYAFRTANAASADELQFYFYVGGAWHVYTTTDANLTIGNWQHLVATYDSSSVKIYKNGRLLNGSCTTGTCNVAMVADTNPIRIGKQENVYYFDGDIDEVRLYNTALSADVIRTNYLAGSSYAHYFSPQTDSNIKTEGDASQKIRLGGATLDGKTIGLWHLDETTGTGAYFKDSSINANHGTPSGSPTLIEGIFNKARRFTDAQGIIVNHHASLTPTRITIEAWFKTSQSTSLAYQSSVIDKVGTTTGNPGYRLSTGGNKINCWFGAGAYVTGSTIVNDGQWHHAACSYDGTSTRLYLDGKREITTAQTANLNTTQNLYIGWNYNGAVTGFVGDIDEVKISNYARDPDEISETYRNGAGHRINYPISTTDLSTDRKVAFDIASDRLGTFLQLILNKSETNSHESDVNTVGLWHLEEIMGGGAYLKDSSGYGNHATPTGTRLTDGKISKGRNFNGSSDYLTIANSSSLQLTSDASWEGWIKADLPLAQRGSVFFKHHNNEYEITIDVDGKIQVYHGNGAWEYMSPPVKAVIADNIWTHFAVTRNSSSKTYSWYINGQFVGSSTYTTNPVSSTNAVYIGQRSDGSLRFAGDLDELIISNVARTSEEIRLRYEMSKQTHNITIDFKAKLNASNLIADSADTSFTVDETAYGSSQAASHLFSGEKIVIKENIDGIEYLAQGTVNSVNPSTGAVTVIAWDSGSTFPTSGFTANATVFKWQREYFDLGNILPENLSAINQISLRTNSGSEGATVWLDNLHSSNYLGNPLGSNILSSPENLYFQYRAIFSQNNPSAPSATVSSITLDYISNYTPDTPSLNNPTDSATNQSAQPILKTTSSDADSDYLRYKIELCQDLAMTVSCQTFDQTSSQTGWSGQNTQSDTAYTSGTQASYALQSDLEPNTTYYWRSYAIDPAGSGAWSSTQGTPYSFTTSNAPVAPTSLLTEGLSNPTGIIDLTPEFSAIHNDSDGDSAVYYEIEVNTTDDFTGTTMWGSGQQSMTATANGNRSPDISYAGTALTFNGAAYYWRIRFWDTRDFVSPWSEIQSFTLNKAPDLPSLDQPLTGNPGTDFKPSLLTTSSDADSDYLRYKIELCQDLAMTVSCQTFDQTSSQTGWSGQNTQSDTAYTSGTQASYALQSDLEPNTTYYWRSYAIDPAGSNTWSATQSTAYNFITLATPVPASACYVQKNIYNNQILFTWVDNASNEDFYEVQRRVDGGSWTTLQTNMAADSTSLVDNSVSSGATYQYRVAPYFVGPIYANWCVASPLNLGLGLFNLEGIRAEGLHFN